MFVLGVNCDSYKGEDIISNASCTTNCLAPVVKAIHSKYKIQSGLMTTVHAVTISQSLVDCNNERSVRTGFSGMSNIIPASTGAAKALGRVVPEVEGKIDGMAFRVPCLSGSVIDLNLVMEDDKVGLGDILKRLRELEDDRFLRVDGNGSLTSAGIVGDKCSSVVDSEACMEAGGENGRKIIKIVSWYDNEFGYSCRLMELCQMVGKNIM